LQSGSLDLRRKWVFSSPLFPFLAYLILLLQPDALLSDPRALESALSRLAITSALSVEEDIWSPRFGLKGKIDVSVTSSVVDSFGFTRNGTTPFEIKTGRATAGMEHRAQTMLYTLLMSDRYGSSLSFLLFSILLTPQARRRRRRLRSPLLLAREPSLPSSSRSQRNPRPHHRS
jgi:hypothetical protein